MTFMKITKPNISFAQLNRDLIIRNIGLRLLEEIARLKHMWLLYICS